MRYMPPASRAAMVKTLLPSKNAPSLRAHRVARVAIGIEAAKRCRGPAKNNLLMVI